MSALLRLVQAKRQARTEGRFVQVFAWGDSEGGDNREEILAEMRSDGRICEGDHTVLRVCHFKSGSTLPPDRGAYPVLEGDPDEVLRLQKINAIRTQIAELEAQLRENAG